jgi:hypothetical protein
MKKAIIIIYAILLNINLSFGQLNLSYVYTTDGPGAYYKLSLSGLKYIGVHSLPSGYWAYFKLYNPDHSLFRTITPPAFPGKDIVSVSYISETLFDTDTLIEYLVTYVSSAGMSAIRVCNENGNIILERDSAAAGGQILPYAGSGIFPNGNNSKLMVSKLSNSGTYTVEIYDLPGQFPCFECNNGLISGLAQPSNVIDAGKSIAFPNPFNDFVTIKYSLPKNTKHAFINLFGIAGNLIKKKEIDNYFNEVIITSEEIKQGAYIYQIVADDKIVGKNKIIKL